MLKVSFVWEETLLHHIDDFLINSPVGNSPGDCCCIDLVGGVLQTDQSPVVQVFLHSSVLEPQTVVLVFQFRGILATLLQISIL